MQKASALMKNNEVRYSASVGRQSECDVAPRGGGNTEKKDKLVEMDERRVVKKRGRWQQVEMSDE